jgi:hypothetical protein
VSEWIDLTKEAPDFTVHGFHTGRRVAFQLPDGTELTGIYHGWDVFGANGVDYTDVIAWKPVEPSP